MLASLAARAWLRLTPLVVGRGKRRRARYPVPRTRAVAKVPYCAAPDHPRTESRKSSTWLGEGDCGTFMGVGVGVVCAKNGEAGAATVSLNRRHRPAGQWCCASADLPTDARRLKR